MTKSNSNLIMMVPVVIFILMGQVPVWSAGV